MLARKLRAFGVKSCVAITLTVSLFMLSSTGIVGDRLSALEAKETLNNPIESPHALQPTAPTFPEALNVQWEAQSFDNETLHLNRLKNTITLKQTRQGLGAEYFNVSAYMFLQMATQVSEPELAEHFDSLARKAEHLSMLIAHAGDTWYEGTPSYEMDHLQVRSELMYTLNQLNRRAIHTVNKNRQGTITSGTRNSNNARNARNANARAGETLKQFLADWQTIQNHPGAHTYPQAMAYLNDQVEHLNQVALNLELRWESTQDCTHTCRTTQTRLYAYQGLNDLI